MHHKCFYKAQKNLTLIIWEREKTITLVLHLPVIITRFLYTASAVIINLRAAKSLLKVINFQSDIGVFLCIIVEKILEKIDRVHTERD